MVEQGGSPANWREHVLLALFYGAFFVVLFTLSAYLTFPYDRLRYLIMARASAAAEAGSGARTVTVGELAPSGLSGVQLRDVEVVQAAVAPTDPPKVMRFSELSGQVSAWGLLFGERKVDVQAKVGAGTLEATYTQSNGSQHIEAELERVDVAELGLGSYVGLPLKGLATGKVDITLPTEVPKSTGNVKLEIKGLHIGDGKAKVKPPGLPGSGLTLDEIAAGKLELELKIQDGLATLTRFTSDGKDLKVGGKGTLRLADPLRRSRPDMIFELTFSDAFKNKNNRTKAMFELIGMRPEWQSASANGTMRVHVTGTLQAIRGQPAR